jgi:hypothetical protein
MTTSKTHPVRIVPDQAKPGLSRAQQQFNTLIKKIDQQKQRLGQWSETIPKMQQMKATEFEPLLDTYEALQTQWVHLLDNAHANPVLKKRDKEKLSHLICETAIDLLAGGGDDADLKAIYNRHSGSDFDQEDAELEAATGELMKSMMEGMFGMDFGDADVSSMEKMKAFVEEKRESMRSEREEHQREAEARRAKRKKTAKQQAKEEQMQAEEANLKKSIQEIYRKLATTLHPDRETDPAERERKTALMQKVNVAYGNKDLLQLLELQLQVEQIDQAHVNNIAEDRLKHYNKILKDQLQQLQHEVQGIEMVWRMQFNLPPFATVSPKAVMDQMQAEIRQLKREVAVIKQDLHTFQDIELLKNRLKSYKIPKKHETDDLFSGGGPFPFGY